MKLLSLFCKKETKKEESIFEKYEREMGWDKKPLINKGIRRILKM